MSGSQVSDSIITRPCSGSACELCIVACEASVLAVDDDHIVADHPENCGGCGICEQVCPEHAIECCFEIVWSQEIRAHEEIGGRGV